MHRSTPAPSSTRRLATPAQQWVNCLQAFWRFSDRYGEFIATPIEQRHGRPYRF